LPPADRPECPPEAPGCVVSRIPCLSPADSRSILATFCFAFDPWLIASLCSTRRPGRRTVERSLRADRIEPSISFRFTPLFTNWSFLTLLRPSPIPLAVPLQSGSRDRFRQRML
jgi:hypothetical protein